ncbi:hypothetical protein AYO38_10660 [bacterium SCGC AG-212-C10]|nr:hypothetical protein AYO38_10660 [bacterium SCGC AG-212-C10]
MTVAHQWTRGGMDFEQVTVSDLREPVIAMFEQPLQKCGIQPDNHSDGTSDAPPPKATGERARR